MDINWIDQQGVTQGTPVNRKRLMGMQGYIGGTVTIEQTSATRVTITETNEEEGTTTTTINKGDAGTTIFRTFVPAGNAGTIRVRYVITKSGTTTTITATASN